MLRLKKKKVVNRIYNNYLFKIKKFSIEIIIVDIK